MSFTVQMLCLLAGLIADAVIGDPDALWRRIPHPVALFGKLIDRLDAALNREEDRAQLRRIKGVAAVGLLLTGAALIGYGIHVVAMSLPYGLILEIAAVTVMLAQNSLARHVGDVVRGLERGGLEGGREAVSMIVGRDPQSLDGNGVVRAAIESLAENFSDGIVAPAFWYAVLGLPGLFAYKALNTADSMIGHKTARHLEFGWATARLDDLANLPASRLSGLLILGGAALRFWNVAAGWVAAGRGWQAVKTSAHLHRSPNAGWPEAAMAGVLDIAIAGPRRYGGTVVEDPFMNPAGRRELEAADIESALNVFRKACLILWMLVLLVVDFGYASG